MLEREQGEDEVASTEKTEVKNGRIPTRRGDAYKSVSWPTPDRTEATWDSSGVPSWGALISTSAVHYSGREEEEEENNNNNKQTNKKKKNV